MRGGAKSAVNFQSIKEASMRFIPTKIHGLLDYAGAVALIFSPMLFGFEHLGGPAVMIPRSIGFILIAYSLLTKYEWGLFKVLPMPYHLVVDVAGSLFLIISPWLFGFSHEGLNVVLPDVVSGIGVIGLVLVSQTKPSYEAADLKAYGESYD